MASRLSSCIRPNAGISAIVLLLVIVGGVSPVHAQQNATPASPGPVFRRVATYSTEGLFSNSVAVGDFNGDGKLDLVVTNQCTADFFPGSCQNGFATVTARSGNGDGTFGRALNSSAGNGAAFSMVVGDFNHDGKPDLGVASLCVNDLDFGLFGEVHGLVGNGDGTFDNLFVFSTFTPCPYSIAIGDFNLDGNLDLAVTFFCTDPPTCAVGAVAVFLGIGNGNFQDPVFYQYGGGRPFLVAVGDFNGDGKPDLAVGDGFFGGPQTVTALLGNGDGTFQIGVPFPFSIPFVVGDFNGDGRSDLVGASGNNIALLLGNEDGTFQPAITINASPGAFVAADFNGDRKLDLAVLRSEGITVLLGNGHGEYHAVRGGDGIASTISSPLAVAVGDFNNDGKPDLAVDDGSRVTVLLNVYRLSRHQTSATH